jgi:hypothetical protein
MQRDGALWSFSAPLRCLALALLYFALLNFLIFECRTSGCQRRERVRRVRWDPERVTRVSDIVLLSISMS